MLEANCPLCGIVLQTLDQAQAAQAPVIDLPWSAEIRAVKSVQGTWLPYVTGVGYLTINFELIAHRDETLRYSDAIEGLQTSPMFYRSREYWVFPFHDACWSLLLSRTARQGSDSAQVARHLFQILYCTPWNRFYTANWGHDYGGASQFHEGDGPPANRPRILPPEWSFLVADPREYLDADIQECSLFENTAAPMSRFDQLNSTDVFCILPNEVIILILNNLKSTDVCSFRQSSKRVAGISSFQTLPQSFWASRFEEEREMDFALACPAYSGLKKHTDWQKLYVAFKNSLRDLNVGLGIKNRRRIWHILSNISKPLDILMNNGPIQQNENLDIRQRSDMYICSPIISAEIIPEDEAPQALQCGSRRLVVDRLQWPQSDSPGLTKIGVSFIWLNGRSFVSGLRIWQPGHSRGSDEPQQLGLAVPSAEKVVCFDPNLLNGFEIALTVSGIIGLRFLTKSVSGEFAYTTGDFTMIPQDVGVARLIRHRESETFAIKMGFDVCKLVSFQLIEQRHSSVGRETASSDVTPHLDTAHSSRNRLNIAGKIWAPEIPMQVSFIESFSAEMESQTFNLHLNMNFAGPGGRRLSSLQRIVALIGHLTGLFLGFKFVYDDGESKMFCVERNIFDFRYAPDIKYVESSFYIDGAGGERVSAAKVGSISSTSLLGIMHIELFTNMGNRTVFGRDHESYSRFYEHSFYTLEPPNGAVITGFVANLGAIDKSFRTFGIQSQICEPIKPPPIHYAPLPGSQEFSIKVTSPEKVISEIGTSSTVQTTASLSNVRRIRVSIGVDGLSRLPGNIAGLWLEYYNTDRPSIVGQWLDESGSFELPPGAQFTKISIWTSNIQYSARGDAMLGNVIALRFDTSDGQSLRFGQECTEGAVHLKFAANLFEKLDTVRWAFNTQWDHATVTYSPQPNQKHHALNLVGCRVRPWLVPERLFWTIKDADGNPSSVASIHVSLIHDAITGVSFTYTSGDTYTIGSREGENLTLTLGNGEELVRLDTSLNLVGGIDSVVLVSIYTNYKRIRSFKSQAHFQEENRLPCMTSEAPPADPDHVYKLHPSSEVAGATPRYEVFSPTDAENFVGFWGIVGRRERRLQNLGPIFTGAKTE